MTRLLWAAIIVATPLFAGCSGKPDWHAKTYRVTGTLTINGTPAPNAVLLAHLLTGHFDRPGTIPYAIVNENGTFSFTTYNDNDGLPEGEFALTLTWPMTLSEPGADDRLSNKYESLDSPVATILVKAGKNEIPPIQLTNVQVRPAKTPTAK